MRYEKYTVRTTTEAEDVIISMLDDLGVEGALIEDKVPLSQSDLNGMFVDIPPEAEADDGEAYVSFFLEEGTDHSDLIEQIKAELADIRTWIDAGSCTITSSVTEDADYLNNWKKYFHQFYIDDILFIPSWEEAEDKSRADMVINIDPGTAFGTGMHETTQLCIRALRKHVTKGCRMLDVGTGSGVLSILAFKFGAGNIVATDLDECAKDATADNLRSNGLEDADFSLIIGNIIDDDEVKEKVAGGYDIVAANILAEVLIPLMPSASACLREGGICIMSGIIEGKEDAVAAECEKNGLKVLEINRQGEWAGITAVKKAQSKI